MIEPKRSKGKNPPITAAYFLAAMETAEGKAEFYKRYAQAILEGCVPSIPVIMKDRLFADAFPGNEDVAPNAAAFDVLLATIERKKNAPDEKALISAEDVEIGLVYHFEALRGLKRLQKIEMMEAFFKLKPSFSLRAVDYCAKLLLTSGECAVRDAAEQLLGKHFKRYDKKVVGLSVESCLEDTLRHTGQDNPAGLLRLMNLVAKTLPEPKGTLEWLSLQFGEHVSVQTIAFYAKDHDSAASALKVVCALVAHGIMISGDVLPHGLTPPEYVRTALDQQKIEPYKPVALINSIEWDEKEIEALSIRRQRVVAALLRVDPKAKNDGTVSDAINDALKGGSPKVKKLAAANFAACWVDLVPAQPKKKEAKAPAAPAATNGK